MTCSPTAWTPEHVRHLGEMLRQGRNPAARVYESIGPDFFLALAPGWLNLGLWEGDGSAAEAEAAAPVVADAARLPIADGTVDGIISVEAAFHFSSRRAFFEQCHRVLRPGGVVTMSDISTERLPRGPAELLCGLTQLRLFGLRPGAVMTARQIAAAATSAGLADVRVTWCGDRVIAPALRLAAARLSGGSGAPGASGTSGGWGAPAAPAGHVIAARALLRQVELLWRRRLIDYVLLRAVRP
jgi:SAM-dependent methyltransferase